MVDFRNILERGKSNYTVVFNKLSPRNNGVFKAAYNYINDAFPKLENEGIPADDVDTILSTTIGGMLFGVNETYQKYDINTSEEEAAEIDLDDEKSPFVNIPKEILDTIEKLAKEVVEEELSEMAQKLSEQLGISSDEMMEKFGEVLSLSSATNLMSYLMIGALCLQEVEL